MATDKGSGSRVSDDALYFFPEQQVSRSELEAILAGESLDRRAWAISHLLRYAVWEDIWLWTTRDEVRELFPHLDLPPALRASLGRMLKVEATVDQ